MIGAFIGGALFGAFFVCASIAVAVKVFSRPKLVPKETAPSEERRSGDDYESRIALQWQNMAIYDGTERGQRDIIT